MIWVWLCPEVKHIDLREHIVHDAVDKKVLKLVPIESAANVADQLTKPLGVLPSLRKRLMGLGTRAASGL